MRTLNKFQSLFCAVLCIAGCANDAPIVDIGATGSTPEVAYTRTISCQAGLPDDGSEGTANGTHSVGKRFTSLNSRAVLWDEGDQFQIRKEGTTYVLEATASATSAGLGIRVTQTSGSALVRYSAINVKVNNVDVTSKVTSTSSSVNNDYKLGVYTIGGKYCYAPAGTSITAEVNRTGAIPVVQTSSSSSISSSNKAVVRLTGVEYSLDNGVSWTKLTSLSQLTNGFNSKREVAHTLTTDGLDVKMALVSGQSGHTVGSFRGTASSAGSTQGSVAVFPASAFEKIEAGKLSITLPSTQSYVENSFDHTANVMVGMVSETGADECDATFKNMCGVLQLQLTGDGITLSKVTVTDKAGKSLWGNSTLSQSAYTAGISCDMIANGGSTLTLNCDGVTLSSEPTEINMVVPVGAFSSGFDVVVTTSDMRTQTFSTTKSTNVITRGAIKAMPQIAVNNLSTVVFNVENTATQQYMSYGKYAYFGATSYFTTYKSVLNTSLCMNQDRPAEYRISLPSSASYTVTLSDKTTGKDVYANRSFTSDHYDFYNMVPGHEYGYSIKKGSSVVKSGEFTAAGQVRMVRIDDSFNCRDLGGWIGLDGHMVKYEWLYRTGSLNGQWVGSSATTTSIAVPGNYVFSAAGQQQVSDLNILSELDLRGRTGDGQSWSNESNIHSRSLLEPHIPIASVDFKQITTDAGLQQPLSNYAVVQDVAFIIDQVVNKNHPVAYHCKSGADRTGAVSMIILSLLGVDQGDVARDYELTTMSREKLIFNGTSGYQERLASSTSYGFFKNGFTTLTQGNNAQEKAYYYLNQYFKSSGVAINASDLDAFIKKMLGLTSYTHPTWATNNGLTLSSIYNK